MSSGICLASYCPYKPARKPHACSLITNKLMKTTVTDGLSAQTVTISLLVTDPSIPTPRFFKALMRTIYKRIREREKESKRVREKERESELI